MHKVLETPELLESTLEFLNMDSNRLDDLKNCTLVAKCWAPIALRVLWGGPPGESDETEQDKRIAAASAARKLARIVTSQQNNWETDLSRFYDYASYMKQWHLSDVSVENIERYTAMLYALSRNRAPPSPFSRLRKLSLTLYGLDPSFTQLTVALFLKLLGENLKSISFDASSGTSLAVTSLADAIQEVSYQCPRVQGLSITTFSSPVLGETYSTVLPDVLSKCLTSTTHLETLHISTPPVLPTAALMKAIALLPSLTHLKLHYDSEDLGIMRNAQYPTWSPLDCGFTKLKRMDLALPQSTMLHLLGLISQGSPLRELLMQVLWRPSESDIVGVRVFPPKLALQSTFKYLDITPNAETRGLSQHVLESISGFTSLARVAISGTTLLRINDEEIVASLSKCPRLITLWLQAFATDYDSEETHRLSLACLKPLLDNCRKISKIGGCFDLDVGELTNIVPDPNPRRQLERIQLGTSYFSRGDPSPTTISNLAAHLSALSSSSPDCKITIYRDSCTPIIGPPPKWQRNAEREQQLTIFNACLDTVKSLKRMEGVQVSQTAERS